MEPPYYEVASTKQSKINNELYIKRLKRLIELTSRYRPKYQFHLLKFRFL